MADKQKIVGLLGGSFNPAHKGHIHLSLEAISYLNLDEVWWLVSPQNPLKTSIGLPTIEQRIGAANVITNDIDKITISNFESQHKTQYSYDTILKIQQQFPEIQFVWLMGADNLVQFHLWRNWRKILDNISVAIFDRSPYNDRGLASNTAIEFSRQRVLDYNGLLAQSLPAWCYIRMTTKDISSTQLRGEDCV